MLNALVSPGKINGLFTNGRAAFPSERVCASIPGQLTPSRGGEAPAHPGSLLWLIRRPLQPELYTVGITEPNAIGE